MCESLVADFSFVSVENIDVCENVITQMNERASAAASAATGKGRGKAKEKGPGARLSYVLMDACKMTYEDSVFDMVIDKVWVIHRMSNVVVPQKLTSTQIRSY